MKKQIYNLWKSLLAIIIVAGGGANSMAQNAKLELLTELPNFYVNKMSTNGRFIVGGLGGSDSKTIPFIWDRDGGVTTIIRDSYYCFYDVSNDGTVVGAFFDPSIVIDGRKVLSGGWWKDNVWHSLGGHPDYPITELSGSCGSFGITISADGKYIGGYVFVTLQRLVPCVWKRNDSGEYVFYKEYCYTPNSLRGARPWDMSDDGQAICGWDSTSETGDYWTATMWAENNKMIKPSAEHLEKGGTLWGINPEGTISVGVSGGTYSDTGIVMKADGTYEIVKGIRMTSISSTGMAVGSGIWTKELGVWSLAKYCETFWNTPDIKVGTIMSISGNGKFIAGWTMGGTPYTITFEGDIVATSPRNAVTSLDVFERTVTVTWDKPYYNGETITGYDVWRGTQKLTEAPLSASTFTFVDENPSIGMNNYTITAIYQYESGIKTSEKSVESSIEVIAPDGCFSPKQFNSEVIYNKTVNLSWNTPGPNYSSNSKLKSGETKIELPYIKSYRLRTKEEIHPASMGGNIYVSRVFNNGKIKIHQRANRYKQNGDYAGENIMLDESNRRLEWFGLTHDGEYYYSTQPGEANGKSYRLSEYNDNGNISLIRDSYLISETERTKNRITYIPTLDDNKGGFEIGNETESWFYKKDLATEIGPGLKDISNVCGTAYYNNKIYASIQNGSELKIKIYDVTTGEYTNEYIDLRDQPKLMVEANAQMGGLTVFRSSEGVDCLAVVIVESGNAQGHQLVFLQIEESKELLGYNLYKNDVKLNTSLITETKFTDVITVPNDYTYHVTGIFGGGCESEKSLPVNITITPIGTCNTPTNLKTEVIRDNIQVTWSRAQATIPNKLVGYNLYRNGVKINEELITETFYTDTKLEMGEYTYQIEAFYNNSCISDKSNAVVAEIVGYNSVTKPENLSITVDNAITSTLKWEEPSLGDYANLRWYNGGAEWSIGEVGGGTVYVGSKWDANDLSPYFDYTLIDFEFYPTANTPHTFYVYIDGKVVLTQELASVKANAFNLVKLDQPIAIEKGKELMVAYKVTNKNTNDYAIGADKSPVKNGKSDLISYDGVKWESLFEKQGVYANWAITIRLMPYSVAPSKAIQAPNFERYEPVKLTFKSNEAKSQSASIFINKEVLGYNVYQDGVKVNTSIIKETTYTTSIKPNTNNCFKVEAIFTRDRLSAKTDEVCTYGACQAVTTLNGALVSTDQVVLAWKAPTGELTKDVELKYHNGNEANEAIAVVNDATYYALIQSTVLEHSAHKNLKLKSIEAFILNKCEVWLVVIQEGVKILETAVSKINFGEFNTFEIPNGGIDIDVTKSIMVGLKIKAKAKAFTIGLDRGPLVDYRGNLMSTDGENMTTLLKISNGQIRGNWNITANFEELYFGSEIVNGYNVYRNDIKLNDKALTSPTFTDETIEAENIYNYHVTTLWNTGCESSASNSITIATTTESVNDVDSKDISVFPNPAKNKVSINGEYSSLKMYNSIGAIVLTQSSQSNYINIEDMPKGIYIIEFSDKAKVISRTKLIIN